MHLTECKDPLETKIINGLTEEDFVLEDQIYNNIKEITNPVNGTIYQIRAYGFKTDENIFLENNIIHVDEDNTEHEVITPDNYYTLIFETIDDDNKLKFVYYYGSWYLLDKIHERTKLLDGDLRQIRDNEYILVD